MRESKQPACPQAYDSARLGSICEHHPAGRSGGASELQHVALRMAAADPVRDRRQRAQELRREGEVAAAEGDKRPGGRQADQRVA